MEGKIREYLSSSDTEMIQLGATIMRYELPKSKWVELLDEHLREEGNKIFVKDDSKVPDTEEVQLPGALRFRYSITESEIKITPTGIYLQGSTTGSGNVTLGNYHYTYPTNTAVGYSSLLQTTTGTASTPLGTAYTNIMSTP